MRHVIRPLKTRFTETTEFGGHYFWRALDRCLGVGVFFLVARIFCFFRATLNEISKRPEPPRPEPPWLRLDDSLRSRIHRRMQRYQIHILKSFADRMAEPRWRARCRLEGVEYLEAARKAGRPVVLAFVHNGPMYLMRHWLRGFGFAAGAYMGGTMEARGKVAQYQDRYTPFPEVQLFFFPGEVRDLVKFLKVGNILFMAVDMREGQRTVVETDDGWTTRWNTGAARLANLTGADLMAVTTATEGWGRFQIKISPPIPGEQLRTEADWAEANRHLFAAILPDLKACPDQVVLPMLWQQKP